MQFQLSLLSLTALITAAVARENGIVYGISRTTSDRHTLLGYTVASTDSLWKDEGTVEARNAVDGPLGEAIYVFPKATDVPGSSLEKGKFLCAVYFSASNTTFAAAPKALARADGDSALDARISAHGLDPAKTLRFGGVDKAALEKLGVVSTEMRDGEGMIAVPVKVVEELDVDGGCSPAEEAGEMKQYPDGADVERWAGVVQV